MALIQFTGGVNNSHRVQRWAKELWHTHQRDQFYSGFQGKGTNNIVQMKTDFAKKAGYQMTEGLIMPFESAGVINDEFLEENEESPDFHSMTWTISQLRNAGRLAGEETEQAVEYNLPMEIKDGLGEWMRERRDEDIFSAIASSPTKIYYVNSRAGTTTVTATDLLTLADVSKAKTYAKSTADPKIPPLKISKVGKKTVYRYLFLMHDHVSYDLLINDATYQQATREAHRRGGGNPLFAGALIDWDGAMLFDHDNCTIFTGWGSSSDVYGAESYLLGRQAVIVGVGGYRIANKNGYLKWVEKKFDYENQFGVAVGIIKGEAKSVFNSKDFSVVAYRSARTNVS
jgi:N4-gp56 family major capsid protein